MTNNAVAEAVRAPSRSRAAASSASAAASFDVKRCLIGVMAEHQGDRAAFQTRPADGRHPAAVTRTIGIAVRGSKFQRKRLTAQPMG